MAKSNIVVFIDDININDIEKNAKKNEFAISQKGDICYVSLEKICAELCD